MSSPLENTDKYYRSQRPGSPLSHSAADSTRKPNRPTPEPGVTPVATPLFNKDDTTTDKYYAAGGSRPMAGQPARPQPAAPRGTPVVGLNNLLLVEIEKAGDVGVGVATAKTHAARGGRVEIAVGDKELIAKVAVALDGAVSREEITEDQRRAIRVGVRAAAVGGRLPVAPPPFDPAAFLAAAPAAKAATPLDVDAFLAAGAVDDEDEKLAALTGGGTDGSRPPEPEDNEFLAAALAAPAPAAGTTPAPVPGSLDPNAIADDNDFLGGR